MAAVSGPGPGPVRPVGHRAAGVLAKVLVVVVTLCAAVPPSSSERIPAGLGPFRVELRGVNLCAASEKCLRPDKMDVSNMRLTKDPVKEYRYSYSGDVNMSVPMDDSFKTEIKVSRWSGATSTWTNNVFRMTVANPCSAFKSHRPDIFKQMSDLYYDGSLTDCPIPPVSAMVRDFVVDAKPPSNIKTLPYGRFKAKIKLMDPNQECVSCYEAVTDILPKRRQ